MRIFKYTAIALMPISWYYIGTHEKEYVKKTMFNKGLALSQKFKKYPQWDNYVEPAIVKQASILFAGGNAFIKGMASDNEDKSKINKSIEMYKKDIETELNDITKNKQ